MFFTQNTATRIHRVSENNCVNLSFAPRLSNMNRFQQKLEGLSQNKPLTKLCLKCQLHLKYVLALGYLGKFDVSDWAVNTIIKCTFEWFNRIVTNMIGSYCLSKKSHVSHHIHHIIFITACAQNARLQAPARTQARRRRCHWCQSPTAYSITVWLRAAHALLMRRFSSSTSEILVR